jgi:hypothetical protein
MNNEYALLLLEHMNLQSNCLAILLDEKFQGTNSQNKFLYQVTMATAKDLLKRTAIRLQELHSNH